MTIENSLNLRASPLTHISPSSPRGSSSLSHFNGIRAFDNNQAMAWPGREDPCNMSKKIQPLLQALVDQLVNNGLTPAQQSVAKQDLAMIAVRCFSQGHVGAGQALRINAHGRSLQLDAVDLTLLLNKLQNNGFSASAFEKEVQRCTRPAETPQKIRLRSPEAPGALEATADAAARMERFLEQRSVASPLYAEMNEIIRRAPVAALDSRQQCIAKQVLDLMPASAQGKLKNVPARLISAHEFAEVMQAAAHQKKLPAELQYFRDSCSNNDGLKKAIYCNPHIAARILGLTESKRESASNQSLARELSTQIMEKATGGNSQSTTVFKTFRRMTLNGARNALALAKQMYSALENFVGFATQEMADVPTCFDPIQCPEATRVKINLPGTRPGAQKLLPIHANVVSLGNGRQAVAAMQPVSKTEAGTSNLPAFYQLLANEAETVVFDLRSNKDMARGDTDYCPKVGRSHSIVDRESGQKIQVTTIEKKPLEQAGSKELTVSIQVGDEAPKRLKVIQFRDWPDHGVIEPDQLRSLREVMAKALSENQRVITHCRAGVGRTGTLLAYESLRHNLIDMGHGHAIVDSKGEVDHKKLLQALTEVVAQGRIERGPYFVQKEDQFLLLYKTLEADLKANATALHSSPAPTSNAAVSSTPPSLSAASTSSAQPDAIQPSNRTIGLAGHAPSHFSPEPTTTDVGLQHWQSMLQVGNDVVEMVSKSNRLAGASSPSLSGLGVSFDGLRQKLQTQNDVLVGNDRILSIESIPSSSKRHKDRLVHSQAFEIRYQAEGTDQVKTLRFTQLLTAFDGIKLTARQLNETVERLCEAGHIKPKWLTSVMGVGRPSALLVAQTMRAEIDKGTIGNEKSLIQQLDQWIATGREKMGPLFINSREQREQLITLGAAWLSNKQAGLPLHRNVATTAEDTRRVKWWDDQPS